jgi:hypothetical protein
MNRNIYLQNYKTNIQYNQGLENIILNFKHVYSTLGSIVNDIEFAVNQLLSSINYKS